MQAYCWLMAVRLVAAAPAVQAVAVDQESPAEQQTVTMQALVAQVHC